MEAIKIAETAVFAIPEAQKARTRPSMNEIRSHRLVISGIQCCAAREEYRPTATMAQSTIASFAKAGT